jgi:hypothetical protein
MVQALQYQYTHVLIAVMQAYVFIKMLQAPRLARVYCTGQMLVKCVGVPSQPWWSCSAACF